MKVTPIHALSILFSTYFIRKKWVLGLTLIASLLGCFPEDEVYPPIPIEGNVGEISNSIYDYQTFYSLEQNKETATHGMSDWDLGFEASTGGEHVIINTGDILSVCNLGPIDFEANTNIPVDAQWIYDASSGNTDSLAIMGWVNTKLTPYTYSNNVYAIRKNTEVFKKFKIIELTAISYTIIISELNSFEPDTIIVLKDNTVNYNKISLQKDNSLATIEPEIKNWDLQFTTYQSIIPDDNGVATPYVLRGVLHNPNQTEVAFHFISEEEVAYREPSEKAQEESELEAYFLSITKDQVEDLNYTKTLDAIGYDWKDVDIDFETGTAVYVANTRNIYIIQAQNGSTYKLRFISYYNGTGQKGYPTIHYLPLE